MNFPMPVMDPCPFCEIARGNATWNLLVEDPLTLTLLNGRQYETGQCIVMPRRHAPTLLDLTAHEAAAVMLAAQRIGKVITRTFAPDALLLYQNNGVLAGQEIPHFHMHVVPRTRGSDWGTGPAHLAHLQPEARPAHLDHAVVTDAKLATVRTLQREMRSDPNC
jgi:diadenosine tetraphosphate (Ap4A) HIT family hydrolase